MTLETKSEIAVEDSEQQAIRHKKDKRHFIFILLIILLVNIIGVISYILIVPYFDFTTLIANFLGQTLGMVIAVLLLPSIICAFYLIKKKISKKPTTVYFPIWIAWLPLILVLIEPIRLIIANFIVIYPGL